MIDDLVPTADRTRAAHQTMLALVTEFHNLARRVHALHGSPAAVLDPLLEQARGLLDKSDAAATACTMATEALRNEMRSAAAEIRQGATASAAAGRPIGWHMDVLSRIDGLAPLAANDWSLHLATMRRTLDLVTAARSA